jgi:DNA repair protein RecO (recombination protein O)
MTGLAALAMQLEAPAIVCAILAHGEHGAVVRVLTEAAGLLPGYVRGGRSRKLRPVLLPGNIVQAELRARVPEQLAAMTVELVHSRAPLLAERLPAAAIDWACALTAAALPEGQPYPGLFTALDGLLTAIEVAPDVSGWATSLVRYELLLLGQLGFGIDLSHCAATGATTGLAYVSPKSSTAVSRAAGDPYAARLLRLPGFLLSGDARASWEDVLDGLTLTGWFLARDVLTDRRAEVLASRERLVGRIERIIS